MSTLILATKLYIPPIRPELVSRSRLIERLSEDLTRKLTLISVPAGFGKTMLINNLATVLADFLHSHLYLAMPDQIPTLHHRASEWYAQQGLLAAAIDHALSGRDF